MEYAGPRSRFEESPLGSIENTGCGKYGVKGITLSLFRKPGRPFVKKSFYQNMNFAH